MPTLNIFFIIRINKEDIHIFFHTLGHPPENRYLATLKTKGFSPDFNTAGFILRLLLMISSVILEDEQISGEKNLKKNTQMEGNLLSRQVPLAVISFG